MKGSSHFKCKPHCLAFPDNCSKCIHCGRRPAVRTRNSPKASTRSQSASGKARESFRHFRHLLKYIFSQYHAGWQDQLLHFLIWLHTQRILVDSTASHMHSAVYMSWNTTEHKCTWEWNIYWCRLSTDSQGTGLWLGLTGERGNIL